MTLEIALWLVAAAAVPTLGWGIGVTIKLLFMGRGIDDLVKMHRNPQNTGFGNAPLISLLENNTKALNELVTLTREQIAWMQANRNHSGD